MEYLINIDKYIETRNENAYADYLENYRKRLYFYNKLIDSINFNIEKEKSLEIFMDKPNRIENLYMEKIKNELNEIDIFVDESYNFYQIFIKDVKCLKKLNKLYLRVKNEKKLSKEDFLMAYGYYDKDLESKE